MKNKKKDRYTKALKAYVWNEPCTTEDVEFSEAMADAQQIDEAHRRIETRNIRANIAGSTSRSSNITGGSSVVPWNWVTLG